MSEGLPEYIWGIEECREFPALAVVQSFLDAGEVIRLSQALADSYCGVVVLSGKPILTTEELLLLRAKHVRIFPKAEPQKLEEAKVFARQIRSVAASVDLFLFDGLCRDDGEPVRTFSDFVRIDVDQWEADALVREPLPMIDPETNPFIPRIGQRHGATFTTNY